MRDGDEWVINGAKTYITNGHRADFIVLVAKTDPDAGHDGISLFLVDMDLPGVVREQRLQKLGMHASDTALLAFQDVRVPADALLGQEGKGFYHIMWELQGERLIGAAGCVAGAQQAFDKTLRYAMERQAFGRSIGHFQVDPPQVRRRWRRRSRRRASSSTRPRGGSPNGEYPVREISMAKLYAARMALRGARRVPPDPRRRRLHDASTGSSGRGATCGSTASAPAPTRSCSTSSAGATACSGVLAAQRARGERVALRVVLEQVADHALGLRQRGRGQLARLLDGAGLERPVDRRQALDEVVVDLERVALARLQPAPVGRRGAASSAPPVRGRRAGRRATARTVVRTSSMPAAFST